ncbi:MAG: TonB-dependent receptor [Bacteroidetes bacterium]|nr:TonB-dependent receptor [Bacteroidota bacterium]
MYTDGCLFFLWQNDTSGAYRPAMNTLSSYETYRTNIDPFISYLDKKGNVHKLRTRWFNTTNTNNTAQNSTADFYYSEYQYQKHFNDNITIAAGAVQSFSKVKSELYGNHSGDNLAFFVQADLKWKRLAFSFGSRTEHFKIDGVAEKFTPVFRSGLNFHVAKETYVRTSYGQGYRYPAIAEKFIRTSVGGLSIYPNDSLNSEKGFSSEIGIMQGIKIGGWKGYVDVAAFWTEYKNMIEFAFGQWGLPTDPLIGLGFKAFNVGDTRIKGLDFSFSGTGDIGPLKVTVMAGYTYMDPVQTRYDSLYVKRTLLSWDTTSYLGSDSSNFLKYRFNHLVKADVEIGYKKFTIGLGIRYNSFMRNIDKLFVDRYLGPLITPGVTHYRNSHKTGDAVVDARTSFRIHPNIKCSLICKNVFNTIFMQRPDDMQPPRTWVVQLGFVF